jgi:hypothetical protein
MSHPENSVTSVIPTAHWRTSSFTDRGNCVAVALYDDGLVAVRNSNHPTEGTVMFATAAMHDWIAGIKAGEFDDLS